MLIAFVNMCASVHTKAELRIATGDEWKLSALWPSETGELLVRCHAPVVRMELQHEIRNQRYAGSFFRNEVNYSSNGII